MTVRSRPMRTPQSSMAIWLSVFLSINPSIDYLLRISSIYCVSLCHYVYLLFPPKYTKRFTNQKQSCWDHSLYHGFVDGKVSFTQIDAFGFRPLRTHISSYVYVFSRCMMCVRVSAIIDSRLSSVWHFLPTQFSHVSQIRCKWWNDVETMWKSCGIGIFLHLPPILPTAICKNCRIDWIPKLSFQHLAALAALGALGDLAEPKSQVSDCAGNPGYLRHWKETCKNVGMPQLL